MSVKVLLFGVLADKAGYSSLDFEDVNNLDELIKILKFKYPFGNNTSYAIAVNQSVVKGNIKLNDNDEVALLPPYAGG